MKLPLSRPRTRRSPEGYASVISAPSASTRAAMVCSSKTIDFTGLPPVRRSTSGVLSVNAERLHTSRGNPFGRTTHTGDPDDIACPGDDRPGSAAATGHPGVLKAPDDQPTTRPPERTHPVPGDPSPDSKRLQGEPSAQR